MSVLPKVRFGHKTQYTQLDDGFESSSSYDTSKLQSPIDTPTKRYAPAQDFDHSPIRRVLHRQKTLRPGVLQPPSARWHELIPEITNASFALAFVALSIAVIKLNGQPVGSTWGDRVVSATKIAPTLFPILFAAVVGNAVKVWAHYKAERGATVGTLEQLMGSATLAGTVKILWLVRALTVYTFILVPLWAFSPLGSQSSLRSVYVTNKYYSSERMHSYQNNSMDYEIGQSALNSQSGWETSEPMVRSLYGAALFTPDAGAQYSNGSTEGFDGLLSRLGGVKQAVSTMSTDVWNNVRIPEIRDLPGYVASNGAQWLEVPHEEMVINYTSIIGVPSRLGNQTLFVGNATYRIDASHHDFQCTDWTNYTTSDFYGTWMKDNYHNLTNLYNQTLDVEPWEDATAALFPWTSGFFIDTLGTNVSQQAWPTLAFVSRGATNYYVTTCLVTTRYIQANISCIQKGDNSTTFHSTCGATQIREIPAANSTLSPSITAFNIQPHAGIITANYPRILAATQHVMTSTQTELVLANPPDAFFPQAAALGPIELGRVPIALFERRFAWLFNTFWKASITPTLIVGGPVNTTLLGAGVVLTSVSASTTQLLTPVYALNTPWLVVFFLANSVLCAAAITAVVLKYKCRTPDLLGYVSSLTRDSEFFRNTAGGGMGSVMDGADRARALRSERVRIVDVGRGEEVGRIALVPEAARISFRSVTPGRIYE